MNRDIKPALLTGAIAIPASCAGVFVVNGKQRLQHKTTLIAFQVQIDQLESWQTELEQSIAAIAAEKQRVETNINFLQTQLSQLYAQIAEHRNHKQQLSQDVVTLTTDYHKLSAKLQDLQTQVDNCEQRREELYQSLRSLRQEKQEEEASYSYLKTEHNQLQIKIAQLRNQKQELEEDLTSINHLKPQLQDSVNEMRQSLAALQTQILEYQATKTKLEQELSSLNQNPKLTPEVKSSDKSSNPWIEFVMQLSDPELQVVEAIIHQSDPRIEIKKIAEANITMPELLIDRINEVALDTIGDFIIEPESEFVPPGILEDYLRDLQQALDKMKNK